jgi:hypothetical protein
MRSLCRKGGLMGEGRRIRDSDLERVIVFHGSSSDPTSFARHIKKDPKILVCTISIPKATQSKHLITPLPMLYKMKSHRPKTPS